MRAVKTAIVHDALPFYGGAERVLAAMLDVLPGTPVFTLIHNRARLAGTPLQAADIRASFLDRLPGVYRNHYRYFPLFPIAVRSFNLDAYDLVISSHYAVAHWARVRPGARHISYVHTPLRYLWQAAGAGRGALSEEFLQRIRSIDRAAAGRVDAFAVNSEWIRSVIAAAYGRDAVVIHPPVDLERFSAAPVREETFICVSRLAPHKKLDLVISAFNRAGLPLAIVGEGPERGRLEAMAAPNIRFLGFRSDAEVAGLLGRARAFVHMAAEDFGIAVVEAQAAGCPVISFAGGANSETVADGATGVLVPEQTAEGLLDGLARFDSIEGRFEPARLQAHANPFDAGNFRAAFRSFLNWNLPSGSIPG